MGIMRYIIGIDLGTTNSSLAYVDTHHSKHPIQGFSIPQFVFQGKVDQMTTLPSFCFQKMNGL
jgi:molecular chaperone DnaK (HSP70)